MVRCEGRVGARRRPVAVFGEFDSDDTGRRDYVLHGDEGRRFDSSRQRHCVCLETVERTGSGWWVFSSDDERLTQAAALLWRGVRRRWEAEVAVDAARAAQLRTQLLTLTAACVALFQAIEAVDVSSWMGDEWLGGEEIARLIAAALEAATGTYELCGPIILYVSRLRLERRRMMACSDRCHGSLPVDAGLHEDEGEADISVRQMSGSMGPWPRPNTPSRALGARCSSTGCVSAWGSQRWCCCSAWLEGDLSDVWGLLLPCGSLGLRRRLWWFVPAAVWNAEMRAMRGSGTCGCRC